MYVRCNKIVHTHVEVATLRNIQAEGDEMCLTLKNDIGSICFSKYLVFEIESVRKLDANE